MLEEATEEWLTPAVAAIRLKTSPPTVRKLVDDGHLVARVRTVGKKTFREIAASSVRKYGEYRPKPSGRPTATTPGLTALRERILSLERRVHALEAERGTAGAEREHSRGELVSLRATVLHQIEEARQLEEADEARRDLVTALLSALTAGERAGSAHRQAAEELRSALAQFVIPPDVGDVRLDEGG